MKSKRNFMHLLMIILNGVRKTALNLKNLIPENLMFVFRHYFIVRLQLQQRKWICH